MVVKSEKKLLASIFMYIDPRFNWHCYIQLILPLYTSEGNRRQKHNLPSQRFHYKDLILPVNALNN